MTESFLLQLQSDEIVDESYFLSSRVGHRFKRDADGFYFVDYLGIDLMAIENDWHRELQTIANEIGEQLPKHKDLKVKQKIGWLNRYAAASLKDRLWEKSEPLDHETEGDLERKFPRTM